MRKEEMSPKHVIQNKQNEGQNLKKISNMITDKNNLNLFDNEFDIGNEFQMYYPEGNINRF